MKSQIRPMALLDARNAALKYVQRLLEQGYDSVKAAAESLLGQTDLNGPGFQIRPGTIQAPPRTGPTFSFSALEREVRAQKPWERPAEPPRPGFRGVRPRRPRA